MSTRPNCVHGTCSSKYARRSVDITRRHQQLKCLYNCHDVTHMCRFDVNVGVARRLTILLSPVMCLALHLKHGHACSNDLFDGIQAGTLPVSKVDAVRRQCSTRTGSAFHGVPQASLIT